MITTKEIIDYVMESPHNTNPSVLKSLLNQYSGSGSDDSPAPAPTPGPAPVGDGKTRFYLHVPAIGLSQNLAFSSTECEGTIDWGDGTVTALDPEDSVHDYADAGDYVVTLTVNSGSIVLQGDVAYGKSTIHRFWVDNVLSDLVHVEIGDGVIVGDYAFYSCYALRSAIIGDSITSIGDYAFYNCYALNSVTIGDSITSIGMSAFDSCRALSYVTIPDGVTNIGGYAFNYCSMMLTVNVEAETPPEMAGSNAFDGTHCLFYVPAGSVDVYKAAEGWSEYADRIFAATE